MTEPRRSRRAYRVSEVASLLGVSTKSVRKWISLGRIGAVAPTKRLLLIPAAELDGFLGQLQPRKRRGNR